MLHTYLKEMYTLRHQGSSFLAPVPCVSGHYNDVTDKNFAAPSDP